MIKENGEIVPGSWRQDKGSVFEDLKNGSSCNISTSGKKLEIFSLNILLMKGLWNGSGKNVDTCIYTKLYVLYIFYLSYSTKVKSS